MIPIGFEDALSFGIEHFFHRAAGAEFIPHATFDLQVKTQFVGCLKRGFRWTPGMKAHVVQPVILARQENLRPSGGVCWRITGQGKITAKMRAAKIKRLPIQNKLGALGVEVAEAAGYGLFIPSQVAIRHNSGGQLPEIWRKFTPARECTGIGGT